MNTLLAEARLPGGQPLQLVLGDITAETTEAIVNAANADLRHGAGVAGAILRQGGPQLQAESETWVQAHGPITHESPAWTSGGNLPCRCVIHAVGPVWGSGEEDAKLAAAISGSLRLADQLGLESIAFPAISTGIFGFPKERAANIILSAIRRYFSAEQSRLQLVRLVLFDDGTAAAFQKVWNANS
jgi:O-acetyl-ADP-ribose deacetylase (regulator of RNase III)